MAAHFLGIDLGSAYTKFAVIDSQGSLEYKKVIKTLTRKKTEFESTIDFIYDNYTILQTCTTGYGRRIFQNGIKKTEIICASVGLSFYYPYPKTIIDIGGEDIKVIESGSNGEVIRFYMNDKCAAGTGTFITEIAEKAEISLTEMNELAKKAKYKKTLNSFCTVFAKSEIINWKFNGVGEAEIALGIYLSIINRIKRMRVINDKQIIFCGGVIAYHPYLATLLEKELNCEVIIPPNPQYVIAIGAAISALKQCSKKSGIQEETHV